VLVITVVVYAIQLSYGITLISSPHSSGRLADLAYVLFATLLVSLQRVGLAAGHGHSAGS
jgi:hypothetical protein